MGSRRDCRDLVSALGSWGGRGASRAHGAELARSRGVLSSIAGKAGRASTWILSSAGALALGWLTACCSDPLVERIFLIRDNDPLLQDLVARCRGPASQPDCLPLCHALTAGTYVTFEHCEMHADGDGYQQVHVGYREEVVCE